MRGRLSWWLRLAKLFPNTGQTGLQIRECPHTRRKDVTGSPPSHGAIRDPKTVPPPVEYGQINTPRNGGGSLKVSSPKHSRSRNDQATSVTKDSCEQSKPLLQSWVCER